MTTPPKKPPTETGIDTDVLGEEALATGAEMGKARLGGQEGFGTIQVVRGNDQEVVDIRGTWRSKDDGAADDGALARLCAAAESGETVRYHGPLVDPNSDRDRIDVDVEFTSTERYSFADEGDGQGKDEEDGTERRIFNFRPVGGKTALSG